MFLYPLFPVDELATLILPLGIWYYVLVELKPTYNSIIKCLL